MKSYFHSLYINHFLKKVTEYFLFEHINKIKLFLLFLIGNKSFINSKNATCLRWYTHDKERIQTNQIADLTEIRKLFLYIIIIIIITITKMTSTWIAHIIGCKGGYKWEGVTDDQHLKFFQS